MDYFFFVKRSIIAFIISAKAELIQSSILLNNIDILFCLSLDL